MGDGVEVWVDGRLMHHKRGIQRSPLTYIEQVLTEWEAKERRPTVYDHILRGVLV